ncbi:MFS transporter [Leucobacter tardus]|uniref:MFS transporter n=1 Tax=Leucobacter tardus TaxID=501483 RepID=A0A939TU23_9MICO|nr:MFS transporter [Leucobacter tardus]MBO2989295.1 MFS transporter [Leucobacter tardus]
MGWEGHRRGSPAYRRILIALLGAGIATFAQLYSPQGILPLIASDLEVDPSRASLSISAATTGLAVSVLPWSLVADRIGRVTAMRIALVSATVLGLCMPWCPWFDLLLGVRILEGVALGGIPGVAVTYLSEEIDRTHAAVAAGTYVAGTTIGGLAGRLIAAPIADAADWRLGAFAVAVLAAIATAVFFIVTPRPQGFRSHPASVRSVLRMSGRLMRTPGLVVLYGQGFLLMGGFVAAYNYLTFRLEAAPFFIPIGLASLLFLAYLAGTVSSRLVGGLAGRTGRKPLLLGSTAVMIAGTLLTLSPSLVVVVVGLVVLTGGFFGAHSVASGWAGARAEQGRSQSASLYNLWYYAGSSVFGFLGGIAWSHLGWAGVVVMVTGLALLAAVWAATTPEDAPRGTRA